MHHQQHNNGLLSYHSCNEIFDVPKLSDGDVASALLIEDRESIVELAIEGFGLHVLSHEVQESREIEGRSELFLGDNGFI
ncbi:hypothetical protein G4B88_008836 [Cannabis sativa]|uniref:Uncharacterized protein n=1 Tax=Cannabis sativa TaxID=3483 RepID=A0A7J6FQQ6_CANSA|nr:hypothetical protein G4B88_008836 [Cannabis sativa]